ncbi:MAG: ZIP family metal transporter [Clostridia bacterium]|nr:ZIP family metal transporter [Clostridia bacterium]
MLEVLKITIIMTLLGGISSGAGGAIASLFKVKSHNKIAGLYEITAGIMTGIVCIDMLPESFDMAPMPYSIIGIIIGIVMVLMINAMVEKSKKSSAYSTVSLVVMISMSLHNAIEGLAIGSGFSYSFSLGFSILISMFLHDIPEGMVVGITSKTSVNKSSKNILNSVIVGACVGIGCFFGNMIGNINDNYISFCLSIAAGAMLYIVACELIPNSKELKPKKVVSLMYILGIIIGGIVSKL